MPALKSGAIDASEWIDPWLDMAIGLHEAVSHYYYPAFHEPGSGFSVGMNKAVWDSLDAGDRRLIETVAAAEFARSLAEFNANNAFALRRLREHGAGKIQKFDNAVMTALLKLSNDVVAEIGSRDELSRKIFASYHQFRTAVMDWSDISERAYMNGRGLG